MDGERASERNLQLVFKALTNKKSYSESFVNNKGAVIVLN
jgi:hypothetical protein